MKFYIIAGEASGDLHASNLIRSILKIYPGADFRCYGGDLMTEAGAVVAKHYREMAFMGIWEVIKNYGVIRQHLEDCRNDLLGYGPDALILVDYAGFNLRMAEFAKKQHIKVFYYISPKIWAWGKWRVKRVRHFVDHMFVNLPFEVDFYKDHGYHAEYYGNPVVDSVADYKPGSVDFQSFVRRHSLDDKPIIALLAGSRKQEIHLCLPEMLAVTELYPDHQFVIAGAPSLPPEFYGPYLSGKKVRILHGQTYEILKHATAAVVTSGTATLETALHRVPQVVIYKTSTFTYYVGRPFVDIRFFSLVNLIMDREVVKELLQYNLARDIRTELDKLLFDEVYRKKMLDEYDRLIEKTGKPGVSDRVAQRISALLEVKK
jgi:lipid-A-disaccharide synthase